MTAQRDTRVGFCAALINGPSDQRPIAGIVSALPGSEVFIGEDMFSRRGKSLSGALLLRQLLQEYDPKSEAGALTKSLLKILVDKECPESQPQSKLSESLQQQPQMIEDTQLVTEVSPSESQEPDVSQKVVAALSAKPISPSEKSKKSSTSKKKARNKRKLAVTSPDPASDLDRALRNVVSKGAALGDGQNSEVMSHTSFDCEPCGMPDDVRSAADHLLSQACTYSDTGLASFTTFEYGFNPEECSVCNWAAECRQGDPIDFESSEEQMLKTRQRHNAAETLAAICHVAVKHGLTLPQTLHQGGIKFGVGCWSVQTIEDGMMHSYGKT